MKQLAFLDANVLAKPFTRTILLVGAAQIGSDYVVRWSQYAEAEGTRHLPPRAQRLDIFRSERGIQLSPNGQDSQRYLHTDPKDRQILADAVADKAVWLVTENVPDFGWEDPRATGIIAIHYDLFLAQHLSVEAYREALDILSHGRAPIEAIHSHVSLLHPHLFKAMASAFPNVEPMVPLHNPPHEILSDPLPESRQ